METQPKAHSSKTLNFLQEYKNIPENIILNGKTLTIPELYHIYNTSQHSVKICEEAKDDMTKNSAFLNKKVNDGCIIYGVNTGYGGSADVRSNDIEAVQKALISHLNAGFGETLPCELVRAVMLVRANSLCLAYSGVRSIIPEMLAEMINKDVIPVVPKRGSVSASGDLMPTSYIAACMNASDNARIHGSSKDEVIEAAVALKSAGIEPIVFQAKEGLAVINAASFASTLAACVLYDANISVFLTQICTALSVEALQGRVESFHPTIHICMPHPGQQEVAKSIKLLLKNSKLAIQELDMNKKDKSGLLKQDRYALRSSPQWLGPVVETIQESIRRITIELNSVNDNPIIDHRNEEILHGANFQGTQITVAMDQTRQALQLCGKLLFGQMQEIVNVTMNNGLPPNLSGTDINTDFGFKGMDTAMASYMSELDYLTNNMSNHVLSAELHNQAVNSMGLVSARYTQQALEILRMMISNIMCAQVQAIDLRWLKFEMELLLDTLYEKNHLKINDITRKAFPWYNFAFTPRHTAESLIEMIPINGLDKELFYTELERGANRLMRKVKGGKQIAEVSNHLGKGTKKMYLFLRKQLQIPFHDGTATLDTSLQKIFQSIKSHTVDEVIEEILEYVCSNPE